MEETEIQKKRKELLQFIATLGGFLGVIVALNPSQFELIRPIFVVFLALFIVCSLVSYSYLLFDIGTASSRYRITIAFLSLSFSVLLTVAISPVLAPAFLNLQIPIVATIAAFFALLAIFSSALYFLVIRLLTMEETDLNKLRKDKQR